MTLHHVHPGSFQPLHGELLQAQRRFATLEEKVRDPRGGQQMLTSAVGELRITLEELSSAAEELAAQHDEFAKTRESVEGHRRRYEELFELAPDAYVITDHFGTIREANRAAAATFNVPPRFLPGKPLPNFVEPPHRRDFRAALTALAQGAGPDRPWSVRMRRRHADPFWAELTVDVTPGRLGEEATLRWLLRDGTERKGMEEELRRLNAGLERRVQERTAELERTLTEVSMIAEQLQRALDSRVVIEQAKGRLMERAHLDAQGAFDLLRGYARRHGLRLHDVAGQVVDGSLSIST